MDGDAGQRGRRGRQRRRERLAFARLHLRGLAPHHGPAAEQLDVEMPHAKRSARQFTDHCEGAGYQIGSQTIAVQIATQNSRHFGEFMRREQFESF